MRLGWRGDRNVDGWRDRWDQSQNDLGFMNREIELKLQAYLDGELTTADAQVMDAQIKANPEIRDLAAELQWTKAALRGNDLERRVPDSREFYWSQIERTIQAPTASTSVAPRKRSPLFPWLYRFWPQVGGAWAAALGLVIATVHFGWLAEPGWIETNHASNDIGAVVFRSDSERLTMVWLYDHDNDDASDDSEMDTVN
jgi:anti-sigma factor RsiW